MSERIPQVRTRLTARAMFRMRFGIGAMAVAATALLSGLPTWADQSPSTAFTAPSQRSMMSEAP